MNDQKNRPNSFDLVHSLDVDQSIPIIDLCTPNMEVNEIVITSVIETKSLTSHMTIERFPNLRCLWPILACYPSSENKHEHGEPLLANIPCKIYFLR